MKAFVLILGLAVVPAWADSTEDAATVACSKYEPGSQEYKSCKAQVKSAHSKTKKKKEQEEHDEE